MKKIAAAPYNKITALFIMICFLVQICLPVSVGAEGTDGMKVVSENAVGDVSENSPRQDAQAVVSQRGDGKEENEERDGMLMAENGVLEMGSIVSDNSTPPIKVLFVGNSFTSTAEGTKLYSVGKMLSGMAEQTGKNIQITTLAYGGAKLSYYAGARKNYYADLQRLLWGQEWDYIVLQENSIVPAFSLEKDMLPALEILMSMISSLQPDAKVLLYMTHGYTYSDESLNVYSGNVLQRMVAAGYHTACVEYGIEVVPAGMHFGRAQKLYPYVDLYRADRKHPNDNGVYMLAAAFYCRFFGKMPIVDVDKMPGLTMTQQQAVALSLLVQDGIVTDRQSVTLKVGAKDGMRVANQNGLTPAGVQFYSTDSKVVKVNAQTGQMEAVSFGQAVIVAESLDGCQAYCMVKVPRPLRFSRAYYLAGIGDIIRILPDGDAKNITWKSSSKRVATVDKNGQITAKYPGVARITATSGEDGDGSAGFDLYVSGTAVNNLAAQPASSHPSAADKASVKLTWGKVSGNYSYAVYRSTKKNGTYEQVGRTTDRQYTDKTAKPNQTYYYKVQPVSSKSELCNGPMSGAVSTYVLSVSNVKVKKTGNKTAKISWKKNTKAKGYQVYRATKKTGKYTLLTTIKKKSTVQYTDKKRTKGKKYYYKVVPYWTAGNATRYGKASVIVSG